jgi:hypothetical protein
LAIAGDRRELYDFRVGGGSFLNLSQSAVKASAAFKPVSGIGVAR